MGPPLAGERAGRQPSPGYHLLREDKEHRRGDRRRVLSPERPFYSFDEAAYRDMGRKSDQYGWQTTTSASQRRAELCRDEDSDASSTAFDASLHDWNARQRRPRAGGAPRGTQPQGRQHQIAQDVDDFLLKLPLGSSAEAAVLEEKIGRKLYAAEREKGQIQDTVIECMAAAEEMKKLLQEKEDLLQGMTQQVDEANRRSSQLAETLQREHLSTAAAAASLADEVQAYSERCFTPDTAPHSSASPLRLRAPYSPSCSHTSPPGHTFPCVPGSPAASHSSTIPGFHSACPVRSPARPGLGATCAPPSPLGPQAAAHEHACEVQRLRAEVDSLHEQLQEARCQHPGAGRAEADACTLRSELQVVTAQLESARNELKQQGHAIELAHQESSASHQQHVLQHRDETRRLNEQLTESQEGAKDAHRRTERATADQARLRRALMDAEIELQRVSNNAVKFEQAQKSASLEASTLAEQVAKLKSSLESTSSLCGTLESQNQDLRAQMASATLRTHEQSEMLDKRAREAGCLAEELAAESARAAEALATLAATQRQCGEQERHLQALRADHACAEASLQTSIASTEAHRAQVSELKAQLDHQQREAAAAAAEAEANLKAQLRAQDEAARTAQAAAVASTQQEAEVREQQLVAERDRAVEREQSEREAAAARAAAEGSQEAQLLTERYEHKLQLLQEELQASNARHADDAAETEARLRTKHSLAVACLHETHEADLELLRRKVSEAQGEAAELRQAAAKHKADAEALLDELAQGRTQLNQANATLAEQAWQLEAATKGSDRQASSLADGLSSATSQLRSTQAQLVEITAQADELRTKCQRCDEERERASDLHRDSAQRAAAAETLVAELQGKLSQLEGAMAARERDAEQMCAQRKDAEERSAAADSKLGAASAMLNAAEDELSTLEQRCSRQHTQLAAITSTRDDLEAALAVVKEDFSRVRTALTDRVTELSETGAAEAKARLSAEERCERLQEEVDELEADLKSSQAAYQQRHSTLNQQIDHMQQRATHLEQQLSEAMAVLEARKVSQQRDADSLAIQSAANKLDLQQLQSNNSALQEEVTMLKSRGQEDAAIARSSQHALQTDRDAQEARWASAHKAYCDLERTHLEMTAAFTLAKRQLSGLEQRHAEARAEWGVLSDTLKGRVSALVAEVEQHRADASASRAELEQNKIHAEAERGVSQQQVAVLRRQLAAKAQQVDALAEKLALQKKVLAEHNDERAAVLQGALEERDRALAKLRAQHDAALARLDDAESQVSTLDQQIGANTLRADKLQVTAGQLEKENGQLRDALQRHEDSAPSAAALQLELATAQETINALQAHASALQQQLDAAAACSGAAHTTRTCSPHGDAPDRGSHSAAACRAASPPHAAPGRDVQVSVLQQENTRLLAQLQEHGRSLVELRRDNAMLQAALDEAAGVQSSAATGSLHMQLSDSSHAVAVLQRQLNAKERRIAALQAEVASLHQRMGVSAVPGSPGGSNDTTAARYTEDATLAGEMGDDGKASSMRRLQGLLYTRERELRKFQLRVQSLESQLQVDGDRSRSPSPSMLPHGYPGASSRLGHVHRRDTT